MDGKEIILEGQRLEQAIQDAAEDQTWALANWLLATFGPPVKGRPPKRENVSRVTFSLKQYSEHSRYTYNWLRVLRQMAHEVPAEDQVEPVSTMRDKKAGRKTRAQHHDDIRKAVAEYHAQQVPKKAKKRKKPQKALLTKEQIESLTPTDEEMEADAPRIARADKGREVWADQFAEKRGMKESHISELIERIFGRNNEGIKNTANELFAALEVPDLVLSPGELKLCLSLIRYMKMTLDQVEEDLMKLVPVDWDGELERITED